jgi:hypothetical protein
MLVEARLPQEREIEVEEERQRDVRYTPFAPRCAARTTRRITTVLFLPSSMPGNDFYEQLGTPVQSRRTHPVLVQTTIYPFFVAIPIADAAFELHTPLAAPFCGTKRASMLRTSVPKGNLRHSHLFGTTERRGKLTGY